MLRQITRFGENMGFIDITGKHNYLSQPHENLRHGTRLPVLIMRFQDQSYIL